MLVVEVEVEGGHLHHVRRMNCTLATAVVVAVVVVVYHLVVAEVVIVVAITVEATVVGHPVVILPTKLLFLPPAIAVVVEWVEEESTQ